jgi:hypothetical protein
MITEYKQFDLPYTITVTVSGFPNEPTSVISLSSLTLKRFIDRPETKTISVLFFETKVPIILINDSQYTRSGDLTDEQLFSTINSIISSDVNSFISEGFLSPYPFKVV